MLHIISNIMYISYHISYYHISYITYIIVYIIYHACIVSCKYSIILHRMYDTGKVPTDHIYYCIPHQAYVINNML